MGESRGRSSRRSFGALVALVVAAVLVLPPGLLAAPRSPSFGPMIEDYPAYQGQSICDPDAEPGVVAFQNRVLNAYPFTTSLGISRACSIGGRSEHKEGRAWDWGVRVWVDREKKAASNLLSWLTKTDGYGNGIARARRLGIMYLIWNKRIWFPSSGWRTYCVMKDGYCRDPDDGSIRHPHTNHVHFSFTWQGARKRTTFFMPKRSLVAAVAATADAEGRWLAGRNGGIRTSGTATFYGHKAGRYLSVPIVDIAATPTGTGYWLVSRNGRIWAFGDAALHGRSSDVTIAAMAASPLTGQGYWLLRTDGKVLPFGDAGYFGDALATNATAATMAAMPDGSGYLIARRRGRVHAYGSAPRLGGTGTYSEIVVDLVLTPSGRGYWIVARSGKVFAKGDAVSYGALTQPPQPIVGLVRTATGLGYWLVDRKGTLYPFGDAVEIGTSAPLSTTHAPLSTPRAPAITDDLGEPASVFPTRR